jgi:uncharacterized membrane protein
MGLLMLQKLYHLNKISEESSRVIKSVGFLCNLWLFFLVFFLLFLRWIGLRL